MWDRYWTDFLRIISSGITVIPTPSVSYLNVGTWISRTKFCRMSSSNFITIYRNMNFRKMERFVSEIWNKILHNMEIVKLVWNFCHIFWVLLDHLQKKQVEKIQYRKSHKAQQVLLQNRGSPAGQQVPDTRPACILQFIYICTQAFFQQLWNALKRA